MALLLFTFTVVGVALLVGVMFDTGWVEVFLGVVALIIAPVIREFRIALKEVDRKLAQRPLLSWLSNPLRRLTRPLQRVTPAFSYIDLSLVLGSSLIFCLVLFNSFIAAVDDLVAKGFLSFTKDRDGFVHLQAYLGGYLFTPPMLLACAVYGFYRGVRGGKASFLKILLAVFLGLFVPNFLLALVRGGFVGFENYGQLTDANPDLLPIGTLQIVPMIIVSLAVALCLTLTLVTWSFSLLGHVVKRLLSRRTTNTVPESETVLSVGS